MLPKSAFKCSLVPFFSTSYPFADLFSDFQAPLHLPWAWAEEHTEKHNVKYSIGCKVQMNLKQILQACDVHTQLWSMLVNAQKKMFQKNICPIKWIIKYKCSQHSWW